MFATSGRARLAFDITGVERGADVLLLHAGVNDRRSWHHVVERLGSRHRCVAFDMRGAGETTYERETGWSPVSDALAVLDAAGVEQPAVVACSISEGPTAELNARIAAADAAGDVEEVERLDAWLWLDGPSAEEGRVAGPARELFLDMNGRALRAEDPGEQAEIPSAWDRLGEITVPTLVLVGRLDADKIRAVDEQAAALIPGARLRWLDGVAHVPHLEGDPTTLEEIAAFVDALS
jgi:pimeloyl-ACP methyl ester carboxylesterase